MLSAHRLILARAGRGACVFDKEARRMPQLVWSDGKKLVHNDGRQGTVKVFVANGTQPARQRCGGVGIDGH